MLVASYNDGIEQSNPKFYNGVDMIRVNSAWFTDEELFNILKCNDKPKFLDININGRSKPIREEHGYKRLLMLASFFNVDWVGISNVEDTKIYVEIRKILGDSPIKICAKIETELGCWNSSDIVHKFDGVMVDVDDLAMDLGWKRSIEEKNRIYKECEETGKVYFRLAGVIFEKRY